MLPLNREIQAVKQRGRQKIFCNEAAVESRDAAALWRCCRRFSWAMERPSSRDHAPVPRQHGPHGFANLKMVRQTFIA